MAGFVADIDRKNGQLKIKETFKDGKWNGPWFFYYKHGQLWAKGTFKDGKKHGSWVKYRHKEQLISKGTYKNGKRDGPWVFFEEDGTKRTTPHKGIFTDDEGTGTYKDGVKISD